MKIFVRCTVNAIGLWLAVVLVPGITLVGSGDAVKTAAYLLIIGGIMGLLNSLVRPLLVLLSLPLYLLTLGLFFLVVNAAMLMLTANLTSGFDIRIQIASWGAALLGGIVLSLANFVINPALPEKYRK